MTKKNQKNVAIGVGVLAVLGLGAWALWPKPAQAATTTPSGTTPSGGGGGGQLPPPGVLTPATTLQPNHEYQATLTGLPAGTTLSNTAAVQSFLDSVQGPGIFQVTNLTQSADGSSIVLAFNYLGPVALPVTALAGSTGLPANLSVVDLGPIPSGG